jgi:fibronectin-binding autotransporter adhesin
MSQTGHPAQAADAVLAIELSIRTEVHSRMNRTPPPRTPFGMLAFRLAAIFAVAAGMDHAVAGPLTSGTWTGGGGSGSWSNASNWSTQPTTTGSWSLVFGGTTQTTTTNDIGTISVVALSFENDGSAGRTSTFTLSGSTLALSAATITTSATTGGSALATSGDVIGNRLSLSGSNAISLGTGHNLTIAGDMDGAAASLTKSGGGALFLTGSNSYSGGTFITAGNVRTGSGGASSDSNNYALGSGDVVVSGSGTLAVRNSSTVSNNLTIGGVGVTANGELYGPLLGSFGASNQTAVVSGSVTLSSDAAITTWGASGVIGSKLVLNGPVNLGSYGLTLGRRVIDPASTSTEVNGTILGTGSVVVDGTASVALNAANSYSGGTTIRSGTLSAGNANALGTGGLAVNGGVMDLNGQSLSIGTLSGSSGAVITSLVSGSASLITDSAVSSTYAGTISDGAGTVGLSKKGVGALFLTGSNSYSGPTFITGGSVRTGSGGPSSDSNNFALGSGEIFVSGSGTLAVRNSSTVSNNMTIGGAGTTTNGAPVGAILGSFGASNQTAVVSGSVTLSSNATIGSFGSAGVTGSKLLLAGPIGIGANTLTFSRFVSDPATTWIEVNGAIGGTGAVVVDGTATVYFNGANTYTGATTVRSGLLGGSGSIAGAVTVESGATIAPGNLADTTGTLTVGSLELAAGSLAAMQIGGTSAGTFDQIVSAGNVNFGAITGGNLTIDFLSDGFTNGNFWQLFNASSFTGHLSSVTATGTFGTLAFSYLGDGEWKATGGPLADGQSMSFYENNIHAFGSQFTAGQLVVVPEPSAFVIAGIGVALAGYRRWNQRRTNRTGDQPRA